MWSFERGVWSFERGVWSFGVALRLIIMPHLNCVLGVGVIITTLITKSKCVIIIKN